MEDQSEKKPAREDSSKGKVECLYNPESYKAKTRFKKLLHKSRKDAQVHRFTHSDTPFDERQLQQEFIGTFHINN